MSTPTCAWPSCANKHHSRGLCSAHYKRVKTHLRKHSAPWPATPTLMANVLRACGAWTVTEPRCLWRGCTRKPNWMGLCARDYQRTLRFLPGRKRGEPLTIEMIDKAADAWMNRNAPERSTLLNPKPSTRDLEDALTKLDPAPSVLSGVTIPVGAPAGIPVVSLKPASPAPRAELELIVLEAIAEGVDDITLRNALALAARIARRLADAGRS